MPEAEDEAVYRKAACDLALMSLPDLSRFPRVQTTIAMMRAFDVGGPKSDWLKKFCRCISEESRGWVTLETADRASFPPRLVKSPAASCQRLVDGRTRTIQLLVMGPFDPPFRFVRAEEPPDARSGSARPRA